MLSTYFCMKIRFLFFIFRFILQFSIQFFRYYFLKISILAYISYFSRWIFNRLKKKKKKKKHKFIPFIPRQKFLKGSNEISEKKKKNIPFEIQLRRIITA